MENPFFFFRGTANIKPVQRVTSRQEAFDNSAFDVEMQSRDTWSSKEER
jgi:hypothetical protein